MTSPLPALVPACPQGGRLGPGTGTGPIPGHCPGPKGQVWGWTEALSEKGWEKAGASLGQKLQWEGAEPWCRQLEKNLVKRGWERC